MLKWYEEEDKIEFLKKLWSNGLTGTQVAIAFNRRFSNGPRLTRNAVLGQMWRKGCHKNGSAQPRIAYPKRAKKRRTPQSNVMERLAPKFCTLPLPPPDEFEGR